ncbi:hypothetical protein E4U52_001598 [Claviceps spartinae]|nr:hypothetical protein E4U52_001598 [Claviceps spartinae]
MAFVLYGYAENPRTRVARIVAAAQGIPVELVKVIPRRDIGRHLLIDKFPLSNGKTPALEAPGIKLTETISIALYLAKCKKKPTTLLGNGSPEQEAEIVSWMSWANQELIGTLARWYLPLVPNFSRPAPQNKPQIERGKADSLAMLDVLEGLMANKTHLVGNEMTIADIFVAIVLARALEWVLDSAWRRRHPNCMKHFQMVTTWRPVRAVVPDFPLANVESACLTHYDGD